MGTHPRKLLYGAVAAVTGGALLYACQSGGGPKTASLTTGDAASKVYVAPGQYDEFYSFMSGGFSGQT